MIGTLSGKVQDAGKGIIIIETQGGVGYQVTLSEMTKQAVLQHETCTLFTHTVVKKDTIELFGFSDQGEYSAFILLITVSGVGPKKAIDVLEKMPVATLLQAIKNEDTDLLMSFGIGKKQAQKIVIELQRKIELEDDIIGISADTIAALVALGYSKDEIVKVLRHKKIKGETIEEQIQETLRAIRNYTNKSQLNNI